MTEQNYTNHKRYVIGFHFITFTLIVVLLIGSVYGIYNSLNTRHEIGTSVMFLITSLILMSLFFYMRIFALKAQDRAIRAEENLRHFVLTGKLLDSNIKMSQILSLRFAPDDEFVELARKAITENLSSDDIKKAIRNWKPDLHRA
jgi:Family of unknown function (DUF6526)